MALPAADALAPPAASASTEVRAWAGKMTDSTIGLLHWPATTAPVPRVRVLSALRREFSDKLLFGDVFLSLDSFMALS